VRVRVRMCMRVYVCASVFVYVWEEDIF